MFICDAYITGYLSKNIIDLPSLNKWSSANSSYHFEEVNCVYFNMYTLFLLCSFQNGNSKTYWNNYYGYWINIIFHMLVHN